MAFDISAITGAVNKYLNSISDTNKYLAQKEAETAADSSISGLFEKDLSKAMLDEAGKTTSGLEKENAIKELSDMMGIYGTNSFAYTKADVASVPNKETTSKSVDVRRIDTSVPFPKFDIGNMIADSIASHSRIDANTFSESAHQTHREFSAKGIDPFYTNMIRSSIFDMSDDGEDSNLIDSELSDFNKGIKK